MARGLREETREKDSGSFALSSSDASSSSSCAASKRRGTTSTWRGGFSRRTAAAFVAATTIFAHGPTAVVADGPAAMMGIDLGNEFMKVTLVKDREADLALNIHSQRKTPAAVSFAGQVRAFGDQALASQNRNDVGAFSYINRLLGQGVDEACTEEEHLAKDPKCIDNALGLSNEYYSSYKLVKNETRGVWDLLTDAKTGTSMSTELVIANVLQYAKGIAEASNDGRAIRDTVVTIPSSYNQRQRQAIIDSAKIAGLNSILVHETSAGAVNMAMDWSKEKTENVLFYNMGARSTEVCIAEFSPRAAGMVAGRTTPSIVMKACVHDEQIGGHFGDLALAEEMKKRFIKKYPKLADIAKSPRALRKLLAQAKKTRHNLSAGKEGMFSIENLYEEKDFASKITRADFEALLSDMWAKLTNPIEACLEKAKMKISDIDMMEIVGMAWRMPKVQDVLNAYFTKAQEQREGKDALALGQHLNGDETFVLGASLFAANSSRVIRPRKKVFFSDTTHYHNYTIDLISAKTNEPLKDTTEIAILGSRFGVKKKITVNDAKEDFSIKLYESGKLLSTWSVTGLEEAAEKDYGHLVANGTSPKVAFTLGPDYSGVIQLSKKVEALFVEEREEEVVDEEAMAARRKRKAEKAKKEAALKAGNSTTATDENSTNSTVEKKTEEGDDAEKKDGEDVEKKEDDAEKKDGEDAEKKDDDAEKKDVEDAEKKMDESAENATNTTAAESEEEDDKPIMKKRLKKKNHIIGLKVSRSDEFPKPMTEQEITEAMDVLFKMTKHDNEAAEMDEIKNDLEAFFYMAREKMEAEVYQQVTTEAQRKELLNKVEEVENWSENDVTKETTLAEMKEKLQSLEELFNPIKDRAIEYETRADFIVLMEKEIRKIEETKTKVKGMPWLKKEEVDKALQKVDDFLGDWEKKKAEQAAKPGHEEPVFTKAQIEGYLDRSITDLNRLSRTKKPKERKQKPRGAGKKGTKADTRTFDQLETEEAALAAELEELRQKKVDAVSTEDYDLADKLKTEEKAKADALAAVSALLAEKMKASKNEEATSSKKSADSATAGEEAGDSKTPASEEANADSATASTASSEKSAEEPAPESDADASAAPEPENTAEPEKAEL
ncbi:unnamed protein product [Amoebophrya sp. A25]|nr:unnamed protein product [Amoebophrya sp. A25]|eukprot:GSA25T00011462001.1